MWKKFWLSLMPVFLFAQGIQVWLPDTTVDAGDTVDLPVYVEDTSPYGGIWAAEVYLRFDPTVVQVIGAHTGSLTQGWLFVYQPDTIDGDSLRLAMVTAFPDSGAGTLAGVIFQVVGSPGESTVIDLDTVMLWNPDSELTVVAVDGRLRINPVAVSERLPSPSFPGFRYHFSPGERLLIVAPEGVTGPIRLWILEANGRVVLRRRLEGAARISLSNLPSGLYFLRIQAGNHLFHRRLLLLP